MSSDTRSRNLTLARSILLDFARETGLGLSSRPPRRYLWTDAHAVCTFLTLYRATAETSFLDLALELVDQVHFVLGRHREDDPRTGWISGLADAEGCEHPTAGGLRIGKALNERAPDEPFDETLEWDRDGQYFHYLTKWMHALCRAASVTGDDRYARWAKELAKAAFAGFLFHEGGCARLRWKMSIDLARPLLPSFGQHDALDGYVTFLEIASPSPDGLDEELASLSAMFDLAELATTDPLGIGGLLFDACRVLKLTAAGRADESALAARLLFLVNHCLHAYSDSTQLALPAGHRLAFRELGLSIGLHAIEEMTRIVESREVFVQSGLARDLFGLRRYRQLVDDIESFWLQPENRQAGSWREHEDINAVTLATSLVPGEFLAA